MPATETQLRQVEKLATGVLHLLLGKVALEWPTSTRAHPSFYVHVGLVPNGALYPRALLEFPFQVRWDIWDRAVAPLLNDEGIQFTSPLGGKNWKNVSLLDLEDYDTLLAAIKGLLVESLKATGYLPADLGVAAEPLEIDALPLEIIQQQEELVALEGIVFQAFDSGSQSVSPYQQFDVSGD